MNSSLDKTLMEAHASALASVAAELVDNPETALQTLDKVVRTLLIPTYRRQRDTAGDLGAAIEAAEKVVALQSAEVVDVDAVASRLAIAGRLDEALIWTNRVIALNSHNAHYYRLRASIQERLGNLREAERDIVEATRILPEDPELQADRSRISAAYLHWLKEMRDSAVGFEGVIGAAKEIVERAPRDPNGYSGLAETLLSAGNFEEALRCVDRAIAIDAETPKLFQLRAGVLERLGMYDEAEQAINRAAQLAPEDLAMQKAREHIARKVNESLRQRIAATPDVPEGIALAEELVRRYPTSALDSMSLAQLLAKAGCFDEALRHVDRMIEFDDQIVDFHCLRAAILVKMGRSAEAEQSVERGVTLCREVLGKREASASASSKLVLRGSGQ